MNTPLEVMKAIVENGGPIEAWVRTADRPWIHGLVVGVTIGDYFNPFTVQGSMYRYKECALTDPNKKYAPLPTKWTNDWARWRAVDSYGRLVEFGKRPLTHDVFVWWPVLGGSHKVAIISDGHDPSNWENSLEERHRKTRPMTPREFARFVGGNLGKYLYCPSSSFEEDFWTYAPAIINEPNTKEWLYAENVEGELEWRELPEVEE